MQPAMVAESTGTTSWAARLAFLGLCVVAGTAGVAKASTVAAGAAHTAVVRPADGSVWVWGANDRGQLGNGPGDPSLTPAAVPGLLDVVAVASGDNHLLALKSDGTLLAWGANDSGQVGDAAGTYQDQSVPVPILTGVVGVDAGPSFSIAWKADGSLWTWGLNDHGQLGDGGADPYSDTPAAVSGPVNVQQASAGRGHVVALTSYHYVWGWGQNDFGQLLLTDLQERHSPEQVWWDSDIAMVVAGDRATYLVYDDGDLWSLGANNYGQLGDGTTWPNEWGSEVLAPDAVTGVAPGGGHVLARLTDGSMWSWGRNDFGQVGDEGYVDRLTPAAISLADIAAMEGGVTHSVAVTTDGVVWTWGNNDAGQLGDGTVTKSPIPIAISGPDFSWKVGRPVVDPPGGTYHAAQSVSVTSATANAELYYTLDGTAPGPAQSKPPPPPWSIDVQNPATLKVQAVKDGHTPSDVVTELYSLKPFDVTFTPPGGAFTEPQQVVLSSPGADTIFYTDDGADPDTASTEFDTWIGVSQNTLLKARAFKTGWDLGNIMSAAYVFDTGVPVEWMDLVGVTAAGNTLQKLSGGEWAWDAGAVSTKAIAVGDGWVEATVNESYAYWAFGLSEGNSGQGFADIDFGFTICCGEDLYVTEGGVERAYVGEVSPGDQLRVAVEGGVVKYLWNDQEVWVSNTPPTYPLLVDAAIHEPGGTIANVTASGLVMDVILEDPGLPVEWTDLVGVTAAGNTLQKLPGGEWVWDAGAVSTKAIASGDGWAEATVNESYAFWAFGLSHGNAGQGYGDIDFALAIVYGEDLWVEEGGIDRTYVGEVYEGDRLRVAIEGGVVRYYRNGKQIYVSSAVPEHPLLVDTSICEPGGTISNVTLSGSLVDVVLEEPGDPVVWTNLVNVTASGNTLQKLPGGTWDWDAGAVSTQTVPSGEDGWAEATVAEHYTYWAFGLSNGNSGQGYWDIDYAFGIWSDELWVIEGGVDQAEVGYVVEGDRLRIQVEGGVVRYLRNGQEVWVSSATPTFPLLVDTSIAEPGAAIVNVTIKSGESPQPTVATPILEPPGGVYASAQEVTISVATEGATIHYTMNGIDPTEADPTIASGAAVSVDQSLTLKARAFKPGATSSLVATESYELALWAPTLSPGSGVYGVSLNVGVLGPAGSDLRYTVDGTDPTESSSTVLAGHSILVEEPLTLKVRAFRAGYTRSPIAEADYSFQTGAPTAVPGPGVYSTPQYVTLSSATPGAEVRYTLDGSVPTTASALFTAPIGLATATTLMAKAWSGGWAESETMAASYQFDYGALSPPALSPVPGTYESSVEVTISAPASPPETSIHYTTDGSPPTAGSETYVEPLTLTASEAIRAAAFHPDWTASAVAEGAYEVKVAAPVFDPPAGGYVVAQDVGIVTSTPGATVTYTTDGSEPTESDTPLGPGETVHVDRCLTLRARAWKAGATPSDVVSIEVDVVGAVAGGAFHSLSLTPAGEVWSWGTNWSGQLGTGTTDPSSVPIVVQGLDDVDVVAIASGGEHSLALLADGTVRAWGGNWSGQIGDDGTDPQPFPVDVLGSLTDVLALDAGYEHSLALKSDGTVWAWGANWSGQLGDSSTAERHIPTQVPGLTGVVAIAAGDSHSLALKADGTVLSWGANDSGQLGDGSTTERHIPTEVPNLTDVIAIAGGYRHSLALKSDGTVWAWGANTAYQLGVTTIDDHQPYPTQVVGLTGIVAVAAGAEHNLAIQATGELWAWGANSSGQLGNGLVGSSSFPVLLGAPTDVVAVDCGVSHSMAITEQGQVLSWGDNTWSQLGVGAAGDPVPLPSAISTPSFEWSAVAPAFSPAGGVFQSETDVTVVCADPAAAIHYTTDGSDPTEASAAILTGTVLSFSQATTLKARSFRSDRPPSATTTGTYVFAVATPAAYPVPGTYAGRVHVTLLTTPLDAEIRYTTDGTEPTQAALLYQGMITLTEDTTLMARAFPVSGTLGPSTTATFDYSITPPMGAVSAGTRFSVAVDPSGSPWAWGANESGQLGNGGTDRKLQPTPVSGVVDVTAVAAGGAHAVVVLADGTVRAWGDNDKGQVGDGALGGIRTAPANVASIPDTVAVAAGGSHSLALTRTGRVYAWGSNASGQLGDPTSEDTATPQIVPDVTHVVAIAAGANHSLALDTDGRVWAWGDNTYGQIGNDSYEPQEPDPVVVMTDALFIAAGADHSLAITPGGAAWGWGRNDEHQTGSRDWGDIRYPVPVVTEDPCGGEGGGTEGCGSLLFTGVALLAGGGSHTLALRSDARVWPWGANNVGQLGNGGTYRPNPFEALPTPEGVLTASGGGDHSLALTTTGELWAWGGNGEGQVGDCSQDPRIFPVRLAGPGMSFLECQPPPPPSFSVPSGTHSVDEGLSVELSTPGQQSIIRYTTDGTIPDESDPEIASGDAVWINESVTLTARAWTSYGLAGEASSADYVLRPLTPEFDPPEGDYTTPRQVSVSSSTPALVHYTTDGSIPTASSPTCCDSGAIDVATTTTLTAIALPENPTWLPSETATATYAMHFGVAAAPSFSPAPGTYSAAPEVGMSAPSGGAIHYTTDGSTPTTASPVYVDPISVTTPTTFRAFVVHSDYEPGPVVVASYRLKPPRPTLTPGTGAYQTAQAVLVELPGWDGSVHLTTNGADPTEADPEVVSGQTITVDYSQSLKVRAFKPGWLPGDVVWAAYSIFEDTVSPPMPTPAGGHYAAPVDVSLESATPGVSIRYTLDGSAPSVASTVYSAPIHVASTTLLRARAFKGGWLPSPVIAEEYRFDAGVVAAPVVSPPAGTYATKRAVGATSETPDATVRYTLDGSEPTEDSTELVPGGEIVVDHTLRLRIRAFKEGWAPSEVTSGDYLITGAVAAGSAHSLALHANGTLWAWGGNDSGQLGLGTPDSPAAPAAVSALTDVELVASGRAHALAVTEDGSLWAWGANEYGQVGDGSYEPRSAPVLVGDAWPSPIVAVAAGGNSSFALAQDGSLWSWGENTDGQLGDGNTDHRAAPGAAGPPGVVKLAVGDGHALALDNLGQVWAWGRNTDGQLGDGETLGSPEPQLVTFAGTPAPAIVELGAGDAHSFAVDADGGLWVWGRNEWQQLGPGQSVPYQAIPARLPGTEQFVVATGGESFSLAVLATGQAAAWGRNDAGQLGDGSSAANADPGLVLGLEEVMRIAVGRRHALAVTAAGELWAWGDGDLGQLGDGAMTERRLPTQPEVATLANNEEVDEDPDSDGLSTATEYRLGTDPYNGDTNADGLSDGLSVGAGVDAVSPDTDGDGLSNTDELYLGTNPLAADTDGDGFPDGIDLYPLDPTRWGTAVPATGDTTPPLITIWDPPNAVRIP